VVSYTHKETGLQVQAKQYETGMEEGWQDYITKHVTTIKHSDTDIPIVYGARPNSVKVEPVKVTNNTMIITHKEYTFIYEKQVFFKLYKRS